PFLRPFLNRWVRCIPRTSHMAEDWAQNSDHQLPCYDKHNGAVSAFGCAHGRSPRSKKADLFPAVLGTGEGQPLVEPDGLVSVGPRSLQCDDQIVVGHPSGAKIGPLCVPERGADPRVVAGGGLVRRQQRGASADAAAGRLAWLAGARAVRCAARAQGGCAARRGGTAACGGQGHRQNAESRGRREAVAPDPVHRWPPLHATLTPSGYRSAPPRWWEWADRRIFPGGGGQNAGRGARRAGGLPAWGG